MCQTGFRHALTTPCLKEIEYSVKLTKYIFIVPVLLIADVLFALYLLFNHMIFVHAKLIIQQGRVMCLKTFKYSVKLKEYAATCCILLIVFLIFACIVLDNQDTTTVALLLAHLCLIRNVE